MRDAAPTVSVIVPARNEAALRNIFRMLKPGGLMSFAEPNMLNPQIIVQKNIPRVKQRVGDSPDETAFLRWPLRELLSATGFESPAIIPFDCLHPATPARLIPQVSCLGRLFESIPALREFAGSLYISGRRPLEKQNMEYWSVGVLGKTNHMSRVPFPH